MYHKSLRLHFARFSLPPVTAQKMKFSNKGAVMQIEKALIIDHLRVSKVSRKFRIPTIYNFVVIYREIYYFVKK